MRTTRLTYRILAFFLCACLASQSCERVVDLGIEEEQSRLVVLCNFEPDSLFKLSVSRSRSALSGDPLEYIDNAAVGIYDGEQLLEELVLVEDPLLGRNIYTTQQLRPKEGQNYTVQVKALGLTDVSATDVVPAAVPVTSFEIIGNPVPRPITPDQQTFQVTFRMRVSFRDVPGERNFYHLNFFYKDIDFTIDGEDTLRQETGLVIPLILDNTPNSLPYLSHFSKGILVDDERSDGQLMTFEFEGVTRPVGVDEIFDFLFVELRSGSEAYYNYHSSLTLQSQNTDTVFSEPIILFNNISEGYGIFAGYNTAIDSVKSFD
ncbi:MAG: DUF4249 domain-containing protein [Bacteroidota bacterium]